MTIPIHYCPMCATTFEDATIQECTECQGKVTHFELAVPEDVLQEQDKAERNYRSMINSMVRGLWSGVLDLDQAFDAGVTGMRLFLTQAWNAGLASVGVLPSEQSPEQRIELQQIISRETSFLFSFLLRIEEKNKANGGKLGPLLKDAEKWTSRASDVESRARVTAQTDPKLEWRIDITKSNCASCLKLSGRVKKASYWKRSGITPRNPPNASLICKGFFCGCALGPTTKPLSRGPLPKVP